jgi:hypothetical protein
MMNATVRFVVVIAAAFAAWSLWLADVLWIKGWSGLAWLSGFNWSSLPACAVIVTASSYFLEPTAAWRNRQKFVACAFLLTIGSFVIARSALFQLFGPTNLPAQRDPSLAARLLVSGLAPAIGLALFADWWLVRLRRWTGALVALSLVAAIGLAFATIKLFPAVNGSTDAIHAIKMGYPIFWCGVLVPVALRFGRKAPATSSANYR